jgi:hypothetical protein
MTLLLNFDQVLPGLVPDADDVAVLLHERLYVEGEREVSFTGSSVPTKAQVEKLIEFAAADVASRIGIEVPEAYWPEARRLAALQTASLVETSYFPDQINDTDRSAYRQYQAMFLGGVERLAARLQFPGALQGI